jgi:integrase
LGLKSRRDASDFVFVANLACRKGWACRTLTLPLQRLGYDDLTVHGFRSTFRDWAAEATGYPSHVVEQALAHAIGSDVEAAYRRGDLFAKRVALMDDWAVLAVRLRWRRYGRVSTAFEV